MTGRSVARLSKRRRFAPHPLGSSLGPWWPFVLQLRLCQDGFPSRECHFFSFWRQSLSFLGYRVKYWFSVEHPKGPDLLISGTKNREKPSPPLISRPTWSSIFGESYVNKGLRPSLCSNSELGESVTFQTISYFCCIISPTHHPPPTASTQSCNVTRL